MLPWLAVLDRWLLAGALWLDVCLFVARGCCCERSKKIWRRGLWLKVSSQRLSQAHHMTCANEGDAPGDAIE